MFNFNITTEVLLIFLNILKDRFPNSRVGLTKPTYSIINDILCMLYIKKPHVESPKFFKDSLYIAFVSRYSVSLNEYVFESFQLLDFNTPYPSPDTLYNSNSYRSLIHQDNFKTVLIEDINNMVNHFLEGRFN